MHMPVALADTLLKAAGYEGPYEIVRLHEMVLEARPLQYCFQGFWHGSEARSVVVEVETGEVSEVNYDCVVNLKNDVNGTKVTVQ